MGVKVNLRQAKKLKILIIILTLTGGFLLTEGVDLNPPLHAKSANNYSTPGNCRTCRCQYPDRKDHQRWWPCFQAIPERAPWTRKSV